MTVDEMLRDLRSVKIRQAERTRVDMIRSMFQSSGRISPHDEKWLRGLCRRYGQQLEELCAARQRAIRTNALRAARMTPQDAERVARVRQAESAEDGFGF